MCRTMSFDVLAVQHAGFVVTDQGPSNQCRTPDRNFRFLIETRNLKESNVMYVDLIALISALINLIDYII